MFARHGRIVPRSRPGAVYFVSMLIGAATVFLVAHQSVSYGIGAATIVLRYARWREYICLAQRKPRPRGKLRAGSWGCVVGKRRDVSMSELDLEET
ncbi:MAG: hypothetical protein JWQ49_6671 [Edaphobacter sp.]|nr:hypothetical protein [Edaphobacter sp.]